MFLLNVYKLVFVDESGFHTSMTPTHARGPKGERVYDYVPRNRGRSTTLIAGLSLHGPQASWMFEGGVNAATFETYVQHILAPSLVAGQIVIMDNHQAHKQDVVRELIEARGCELILLPTYSPDLSPIEELFSKVKALVRKANARSQETLGQAIADALKAVTLADIIGWFKDCGFSAQYL
jgi:transposase